MNKYDIIVIGAGIIGLSTAYKLLEKHPSLNVCIIEKESLISAHQSGHNSGVIHSGIYYKPGSLKALNCIKGYKMLIDFCDLFNISYEICGKVILATEEKELEPLQTLYDRGVAHGLTGIKFISNEEIKNIEPSAKGIKGIHVPQTGIVDYKIVSQKLSDQLLNKGAAIKLQEEVININVAENQAEIETSKNNYQAKMVIACAGLYSDKVEKIVNGKSNFRIIPFRGEYYKLKSRAKHLVKDLIYPVPDPEFPFLGVHFTRRMDGTIEAGPNAVLALKKEGYRKNDFNLSEAIDTLSFKGFYNVARKYWKTGLYEFYRSRSKKEFVKSLQKLIPEITADDIEEGGSGVRAQACDVNGKLLDDFLFSENGRVINVCNAPSPAATSSLSIGETIAAKVFKKIHMASRGNN